jgi:hypothetical protein
MSPFAWKWWRFAWTGIRDNNSKMEFGNGVTWRRVWLGLWWRT